jgi:tetratricopeptide (TPR) repeat protein
VPQAEALRLILIVRYTPDKQGSSIFLLSLPVSIHTVGMQCRCFLRCPREGWHRLSRWSRWVDRAMVMDENSSYKIFISYRREDSQDTCGRIHDYLKNRFGANAVFLDVNAIPPGYSFPNYINHVLRQCRVVLVVIGPSWPIIVAHDGPYDEKPRLNDPADFVRIEVEQALKLAAVNTAGEPASDLLLIPLLVQDANMPRQMQLPKSLRELTRRNAIRIRRNPDFEHDVQQLIKQIASWMGDPAPDHSVPNFPLVRELDRTSFKMGDRVAANYPYVREPVEAIFEQAIATLNAAAKGQHAKQGVLVLGEANAGKTRLTLEALIATLPDWEMLVWSEAYQENRIPSVEQLKGRNLVVFLDDLQNYATSTPVTPIALSSGQLAGVPVGLVTTPNGSAAVLRILHHHICQDAAHVVFVATCRSEDHTTAEGSLGWLFQKLDKVEIPTFNNDEHSAEAQTIIREFSANGKIRYEWDGTLGSLVLGLATKHEEYWELANRHSPAVPVLHAMKLLTFSGIPTLTGKRVRAVCDRILHESRLATVGNAWDAALAELDQLEFVSITPGNDGDVLLVIRKDAYFENVVTNYPADYERTSHQKQLLHVFTLLADTDGFLDFGNYLYRSEQYSDALVAYDHALLINPKYASAWNNKGVIFEHLKRDSEAIAAYNQAIVFDPSNAVAWSNKGTIFALHKEYDEALAALNQAIALDSTYEAAPYNKGLIFHTLNRYSEAIEAYDAAIILDPKYAIAWFHKGITLFALAHHEEALAAYNQAIALDPSYAQAWYDKGNTLAKLGLYNEALNCYIESIALDSTLALAWHNKGAILDHINRRSEALTAFDRALALNPDYAQAWYNKGATLSKMGRSVEALGAFGHALAACEKTLEIDSQDADIWHLKAMILNKVGRDDEARAAEERAKQLEQQS